MEVSPTAISDVRLIKTRVFRDSRGWFCETYNKQAWAQAGIEFEFEFVQDNHSLSVEKGVVRGLHFQVPPFQQDKLIRAVRGAIFDVAVDLRRHSSTFGKHVSLILSAEEWNQLLVPAGFAHGFCTLEPNTEVIYKVTQYYSPAHDRGVVWNDPELGIAWPVTGSEALLSEKDRKLPRLADCQEFFE
jgi:dTDP-4-dehydrorhamnose 3,5-epimerase